MLCHLVLWFLFAAGLHNTFSRGHGLEVDKACDLTARFNQWFDKKESVILKGFSQDRLNSVGRCINMFKVVLCRQPKNKKLAHKT